MSVTDRQSPDSPRRLDSHWPEILDLVRQKVAQQTFNTWFLPLVPSDEEVNPVESGVMGVTCPNHFFLDWFSEHHLGALNEAGSVYFAGKVGFRLSVAESSLPAGANILGSFPGDALPMDADEAGSSEHKTSSPPPSARLGQAIHLNPDYTFDNFVVGSGTDLAFAAATAIARNPGDRFNPLFVHGGVGLGKTHLMHAVGNAVAREWPQKRICYITAETFMNELIGSIRDNRTPEFKLKYRGMDVLLVDDVAFLAGKESTQEEFFHTFNALYDLKKQIVLTSDRSPKEITTLEERLRSRFEWGLITDIQAPNLETRMAILRRKVEVNQIYIPDDVIAFIAENITDNIRRLEGALIRLLAFASLTGRDISLEMASEVLSSFFQGNSAGPLKIADVMTVVGNAHELTVDQLKSKRRTQDLARARQIAMYLAREMTGASLNQIGRSFGNRDHSTVAHACQKIQKEMAADPRFRGSVRDLQDRLRERRV
ncbi:chromosomal replication initiator protein DnaA [bacterium]|nr:chromosomal replication initiator protein DnaA [bacterium]PIV80993.1 MAG: chromosomal replication initiator protein DnaA [bacterium CG17_big_fil_post_rev_8_21_14_2_50_64_8]PJA75837.1 MAG: chromosomal replication initiator protein DnaA [bacterium CG_4_9_14_3_um_filter_65_15]